MAKFSLFKSPLVIFCLHGKSCSSWCLGKFNLFLFYSYFFFYKSIRYMFLCNVRNIDVLDEELNLLWPGFLGMVFHMLLAFHINFINSKCCIQNTYYSRQKSQEHVTIIWDWIFRLSKIILHVCYTTFWTTTTCSKWIKLMISDCLLMF